MASRLKLTVYQLPPYSLWSCSSGIFGWPSKSVPICTNSLFQLLSLQFQSVGLFTKLPGLLKQEFNRMRQRRNCIWLRRVWHLGVEDGVSTLIEWHRQPG